MSGRVRFQHAMLLAATVATSALGGCTSAQTSRSFSDETRSPFQAAILADDDVSFDEMEVAVASYAQCLEGLGIQTDAHYSDANRAYEYRFSTESADVEQLLEGPYGQACKSKYLNEVELAFADQVGPTALEDAAYYERVAACMREQGYDVEDTKPDTLARWADKEPNAYNGCLEHVSAPG